MHWCGSFWLDYSISLDRKPIAPTPPSILRSTITEPPKQDGEQQKWWQPDSRWREEDGLFVDGLQASELPDSFDDALTVAVDCAKQAFESGRERVRVDFDTTAGDLTYTTLKNSLPLVRSFGIARTRIPDSVGWARSSSL